jgi:hypothetical protein
VGIDQDAEHAQGFIVFDEAHAAHVRRQVKDGGGTMEGVELLQVRSHVLHTLVYLVPLTAWLDVDRPDNIDPISKQLFDQVAANESTSAANHNLLSRQIHEIPSSYMDRTKSILGGTRATSFPAKRFSTGNPY